MSLAGRIRKAEEQSTNAAAAGFRKAWLGLEEAQSALRRKMRIYPRTGRQASAMAPSEREAPAKASGHTPIISIHGEDVEPAAIERPAPKPAV